MEPGALCPDARLYPSWSKRGVPSQTNTEKNEKRSQRETADRSGHDDGARGYASTVSGAGA